MNEHQDEWIDIKILNENYGKTRLKQPLKRRAKIGFQDRLLLHAGQTYCRMLKGAFCNIFDLH